MRTFRILTLFIAVATPFGVARALHDNRGDKRQVTIRFSLAVGKDPVRCGKDIAGLGTGGRSAQLHDARLYISAPALIDAAGREVPIELTQNDWQYANVALLDFEDKTGKCVGNADVNDSIKGLAPKGRYRGVSFVVGVPSAVKDKDGKDVFLNHSNFATAPAPLDIQAMAWNWQAGRKFIKVEVDPEGGITRPPLPAKPAPSSATTVAATDKPDGAPMAVEASKLEPPKLNADGTITVATWMLHLGSTGCRGDAVKGEVTTCASANRIPVAFASFDPSRQKVVLDLKALFANIDLGQDKGFSTGCMSGPADPECRPMFENLALRLVETAPDVNDSGKPSGSVTKIFRVEAAQ
jgi:hypothetical protein